MKLHFICLCCASLFPMVATAEITFESGTLGPTGVTWSELQNQSVQGTNLHSAVFVGVRFELT